VLGVEKAAILLTTLGPEAAAAVFRHLSEPEVRQVSAAIGRLRSIPHEQAAIVHEEAWRRLGHGDVIPVDGAEFARQMTSASASAAREAEATRRARERGADFLASSLEPVPPETLAHVLADEHPQVTALVLANLRPRKAAQVLAALPESVQPEIVQRIADLHSVPDDLLAEVTDLLTGQVQGLGPLSEAPSVAGAKLAAEIMNAVDTDVEARILAQIEEQAPQIADTIRALRFTFEDLLRLDDRGMQTLLKEIERGELLLALKTASPELRSRVLANLSQRTAEILREDLAAMGPVRLKDVERAQAEIVAVARRLDADQKIALGVREEDVVV
jgi:flagellar motor switch protein FliG